MAELIPLTIRIVCPVHIGCDEPYEPTQFVVDEESHKLVVFSPIEMIQSLGTEERAKFSELCKKGTPSSLLEIYRFLRGRKVQGRKISITQGLVTHYRKTLSLPLSDTRKVIQELNSFVIARTAYLPDSHRVYIPGSAVKGAIRTAYLNRLAGGKRLSDPPKGKEASRKLEKILLEGSFDTDPFRMIKVSDFLPVNEPRSRILYAVNQPKDPSRRGARGPYQILEVIESGSLFFGTIKVEDPLPNSGIKAPLQKGILFEAIKNFFTIEKQREDKELNRLGIQPVSVQSGPGSWLLRIGRHCGAESVTIEEYRRIKILGRRAPLDHATTLWLASPDAKPTSRAKLSPFGWVLLEPITMQHYEELLASEAQWRSNWMAAAKTRAALEARERERALLEKRRRAEEAKRKALEEERRRQEAERRERELAAMSPEERAVSMLHGPEAREDLAFEIYRNIDTFDDPVPVAQALKDFWVSIGKWKKKECSKKQWEKVQKIKMILGEQ